MVLAHKQFDATDEQGNLLAGSVTVRVEFEAGGLGVPYGDRAGAVPLGNPFNNTGGKISFYAAAGNYKITVIQGAFSRVLHDEAMGLMQEADEDATKLPLDGSEPMIGPIGFTHQISPDDPPAGVLLLFAKDDDKFYTRDSAGEETVLGGDSLPLAGGAMTGPIEFTGPDAQLHDPSAVAGSAGTFFYPDYFGNPASGIVHRLNRLLVGVAAATSSDTPPDTQDWLETLVGSTTRGAQLAAISAIGNLGVLGAARTSDFRSWAGAASGGAQGVTGFGWNDDTAAGNPIAVGGEFRGFRKSGVTGITAGAQISGANEGTTVDITPSGGVVAGSTMALLLTNGPAPSGYVNPISAAMVIGSGALSAVSRKGIVILADGLDTSLGGGAAGIAMELARSQSVRWLNNIGGVDAELWANANGLNISGTVRIGAALANFYTISGSASTQPVLSVDGSATDIDLVLQAKGLGINMLRKTDTQTAAVSIAAQLRHLLSSGTAAVGIGVGQNFVVPNASGSNKIVATQEAIATNVTNGTENADLVWRLMVAGAAAAEKLRLKSTGELNLATGGTIAVNGTKVMGARDTGWGAMTGTADKATAYATGTVTLAQLAGRVMAIQAALTTHGLLGA